MESSRLEDIRLRLGLKKKAMATAMGIKPTYYSNILAGTGHGNLRIEHLVALKERYNVNPAWILTGSGEPFLTADQNNTEWIAGSAVPDIPDSAVIDDELLAYFIGEVTKQSGMPMVLSDLGYSLCVRFGKYYMHKNPDATRETLDIPSLTAAYVALLQAVQGMVSAVFELESPGKASVFLEGHQYNFVRRSPPGK